MQVNSNWCALPTIGGQRKAIKEVTTKVFISHKGDDANIAERVARRVQHNGLGTYLDTIDDALLKDGPDLAEHLLKRMGECQQLIAVISTYTKTSWWVPWEIGVGSEKGFRMASFSDSHVALPSYLEKWPALHTERHIDLYCDYSKQTEGVLTQRMRGMMNEERRLEVRKTESIDFHRKLKYAIR